MLRTVRTALPALVAIGCVTLAWPLTAAAPTAKPEEVGLSTDRLKRVTELVERHIAAGSFSGAVTLVARNGRIAHHEAHGSNQEFLRDFENMVMQAVVGGGTARGVGTN